MKNIKYKLIALATIFTVVSCADLDVENVNDPSIAKVLTSSEDYKSLTSGALFNLYNAFAGYNRGHVNLEWTADHTTMTNNVNNWWSEFKVEPRPAFNNTLANANLANVVGNHWALFNSTISTAQTVIKAIEVDGLQIGDANETQMVLAASYFAKGMAAGYIAISHDQGYVVTNDSDLSNIPLSPYQDVLAQALSDLDKVIQICNASSFTLDPSFLTTPSPYSNQQLGRLASTYAAHFLMSGSRTKAQNDGNNWAKILSYAQNGITEDYLRVDDNLWNGMLYYSGVDWYFRIDHRVIRLMDPNYPKRFPNTTSVTSIPPAVSDDARLTAYFKYETNLSSYNLSRGPQLRSHYRISRWDNYYLAGAVGTVPYFLKYISDLTRAEALVMANNDIAGAVDILNEGTRVTVGNLPLLDAGSLTKQQVLDIIWAERDIEVCRTDWAIPFMDARRRGILQRGVLYHFPVPANELLVLRLPLYTYGGESNADGVNTSDGVGAWYTPGE